MENFTGWLVSKLEMALMSPMTPTWNRSSMGSPRLENRWTTERTSRRFPITAASLAPSSPAWAARMRAMVSSFFSTLSFAVLTPQISTFACMLAAPFSRV